MGQIYEFDAIMTSSEREVICILLFYSPFNFLWSYLLLLSFRLLVSRAMSQPAMADFPSPAFLVSMQYVGPDRRQDYIIGRVSRDMRFGAFG